jgi:sporulation protein YlmC with PRC-barrel domain
MNGKAKWILMGWLIVALPAGAIVNAQAPQSDEVPPMEQTVVSSSSLEKANELIGAKVINNRQERLGTIEDIVLTPDRTGVSYVVLSHGGVWGWGGKFFAVPWSQFEVRTRDNVMVLSDVNPADLENAKGFDKDNWPATADENWLGRDVNRDVPEGSEPAAVTPRRQDLENERAIDADEHREHREADKPDSPGNDEPAAATADMKHRRLSELVGLTIKNDQGEDLGELEDIVIDVRQGRVAYAVLSMRSGFLGLNKDLAAIPWSSFEIVPRLGTARLNADKETLRAIAFDADEFPDLEDREYGRQVHERFGATPYWETLGFVRDQERERLETSPWKEGSEHNALFNPNAVRTFRGTIESVGTFRLEGTAVGGLRLRIKTNEGKRVTVHAGPRPYVEQQKIGLHYGDEVTVMGSPAKVGWRDVIVASQIKKGDETLDLRTEEGKPRWNADDLEDSR